VTKKFNITKLLLIMDITGSNI